jgi:hypothetical protein
MPLLTQSELSERLVAASVAGAPPARPSAPRDVAWETLTRRRSARRFADREIDPDTLIRVLGTRTRDLAVATTRGVHLWDGSGPGAAIADEATTGRIRAHYATAPAIVFFLGRPTTVGDYYRSLVEAGMAGYETWLAALGQGLAGCPFGRASAILAEPLRAACGTGTYQLFTLALGWPR